MHPVKSYFDQQYGYTKISSIDPYLSRLRCLKNDEYSHINPNHSYYPESPIFACKFAEKNGYESLLALADEDGKIALHDVQKNTERISLHIHNNAIFDLTWLFQDLRIVTASGDHSSKLLSVTDSGIREDRVFFRHERSVKSLASSRTDPSVFATGGRDGNIILWDIRCANLVFMTRSDKIITKSHVSESNTPKSKKRFSVSSQNSSVTGLAFQDTNTLISCGAGDGCIKIWDLRKTHYDVKKKPLPKVTLRYPGKSAKNGFSNLVIDSTCQKLYANCLDNNIYCYDIGSYNINPIMTYNGHQNNTFYVKSALNRKGTHLISGSSDGNAYIWNLKYSEPFYQLIGHTAEVTCVAWSHQAETCIVTCSDDMRHKLWRIGTEELPEDFNIEGKGKTEILPMYNVAKKTNLKRKLYKEIPKKFISSCIRCLNRTNDTFCENCNFKRKIIEKEIDTKKFKPCELFPNKRKYEETLEPLKDLPNFVMDGVAPHLNFSPPKKKHCDWLTRMRIENSFKRKMEENSDCSATKVVKLDGSPRSNRNKSAGQKASLLNYFKITNGSKCDKHPNVLKNCYNCDRLEPMDSRKNDLE